jgi:DNA replication protein DnaC
MDKQLLINRLGVDFKKLAIELPSRSMLIAGESGIGKTTLFQIWKELAKEQGIRLRYFAESELIEKYIHNDYGVIRIDKDGLKALSYSRIVILDEMWNTLNYNTPVPQQLKLISDMIDILYQYKDKFILIVGTNNKIEDVIKEKSVIRKYYEIFE